MMSIFSFRKAVLPLLLLVQFAGTSAKGGDDGYQRFVDYHFNGKCATIDRCSGIQYFLGPNGSGAYVAADCSWTVIHNPAADYNGAYWDTDDLKHLSPSMYEMAGGGTPQFTDSLIFASHGWDSKAMAISRDEKRLAKLLWWWKTREKYFPHHRQHYLVGLGDINRLAALVESEGKLNKDCAIFVSGCHGASIGGALSRKLNGWNPRIGMTKGVIGPGGGLMSKLILVPTEVEQTASTSFTYGSPAPGSWKKAKYNQNPRSGTCQPSRGVSRPITAGKIFSPLAKGALGAHNVRGWIEDPKGSLVSEVATRGAIAVASGPGIIPASFAAIGTCSMVGQAGVRILYQHAVEEIPDVKHAFELLNKNARPTDGREMSDEEIEQFYEAMSEP
jgi:hypothetical protein